MTKTRRRALVLLAGVLALGWGCGESGLRHVPRNRTLIMDCASNSICGGQFTDFDSCNPFLPNSTSRTGWNFLYEPLYFYNAYKERDNLTPWIAEGHTFNDEFTEVTVRIRRGVRWSDGMPWTAHDLVFTINMLKAHAPELLFSTDMQTWVAEAVALDSLTARISLTAPNPRFIFTYFCHNFDNGVVIVPRHVWEGQDARTFANFTVGKGPVVSGPYDLALSTPQQKVWDRQDDWWASEIGFHELPAVERIIYLLYMDETKRVQNLIANEMDTCLDLRPPNIRTIIDMNPKMSTWTGREPPFGYLDWWPVCLGFNNLEEPFDDPDMRRAVNYAIDREQLVAVGWQGSGSHSLLPFPEFPPLKRFTGSIEDLVDQYEIGVHDVEKSAAILRQKGWQRPSGDGSWTRDGETLKLVIDIFPIFQDLVQVLAAQLQQAGFDASFRQTSDTYTRMAQGTATAFMMGNGGSVRDPYFTLRLYHSRFVAPTGTPAEQFWRWRNEEYDALVDRMGEIAADDPELLVLFRQAMEIWLRELPAIPLVQWYHRIPHNETYWTNWPTAQNPYMNSAYWHRTWLQVVLGLRPVQ